MTDNTKRVKRTDLSALRVTPIREFGNVVDSKPVYGRLDAAEIKKRQDRRDKGVALAKSLQHRDDRLGEIARMVLAPIPCSALDSNTRGPIWGVGEKPNYSEATWTNEDRLRGEKLPEPSSLAERIFGKP